MALFGNLKDIGKQFVKLGIFPDVFYYLEDLFLPRNQKRLLELELDKPFKKEFLGKRLGKDIFALESAYKTKERKDVPYESHRKYIDLQYIVQGEELIEVTPISRLSITQPYDEEKDYTLYSNDAHGILLYMKPGMIAIFFPEDAHMPGLIRNVSDKVIKSVVKYSTSLVNYNFSLQQPIDERKVNYP